MPPTTFSGGNVLGKLAFIMHIRDNLSLTETLKFRQLYELTPLFALHFGEKYCFQ